MYLCCLTHTQFVVHYSLCGHPYNSSHPFWLSVVEEITQNLETVPGSDTCRVFTDSGVITFLGIIEQQTSRESPLRVHLPQGKK